MGDPRRMRGARPPLIALSGPILARTDAAQSRNPTVHDGIEPVRSHVRLPWVSLWQAQPTIAPTSAAS